MTQPTPSADPAAVPVCPRHPTRESYVRCQRCERPVCPDCQRPAAVGVQCVDCVKQAQRSAPTTRARFGGRATGDRPVITIAIIAVCAVVYLLQETSSDDAVTSSLAFDPQLSKAEPWRFLTSAFLHSPGFIPHILFNMYALWLVGPYLEQLLGRARYLASYLLCAVGGSVGVLALADPHSAASWQVQAVGASGAVFGLWGAVLAVNRRLGRDSSGLLAMIGINAVIGFVPGWHIAWQGHLGGLVTGVLCGAVLAYSPKENRNALQAAGLAGIAVLLVLVTVVKIGTAPAGSVL